MDKFEVGCRYSVLHLDDRKEVITVVKRTDKTLTLKDGRTVSILRGVAPNGGDEEVVRIDERGAHAVGGVVRVCHKRLKKSRAA